MKHELNLEFMDLPPPEQLAACNTLHCDIMLRAPPGLVIVLDYPHGRIDTIDLDGYIRLIYYRRIKPPRIMRIAILLKTEYDAIHRPLRLLYNRSSERLEQYHIHQPIIWERQEKNHVQDSKQKRSRT